MVPVLPRPRSRDPAILDKGKAPVRHPPRRQYSDGPLPIKPSGNAPGNARVIGRYQEHDGGNVGYQVTIGGTDINGVGVDEILDYVSALELEQYEHRRFRDDAEILKALKQHRDVERNVRLAQNAETARARGTIPALDGSDSETSEDPTEVPVGKHGRARPNYSKFYMPPRGKGEKTLDQLVGNKMAHDSVPITDEMQPPLRSGPARQSGSLHELPKRRRRRRDPATGELMPLDPLPQPPLGNAKVRQRRKRHPLTGDLMPIGWRYDPEAERNAYGNRREGLDSAMKASAFTRLSISDHRHVKRLRIDTESATSSSTSPVPTKAEIMGQASSQHQQRPEATNKTGRSEVGRLSSDDELGGDVATSNPSTKSRPKQAGNNMMQGTNQSTATTSAAESSPEPETTTSITHPTIPKTATSPPASQRTPKAPQPTTSILSPSAQRAISTDPLNMPSDDESSNGGIGEGEWYTETILGHLMSDPKTHPPELGRKPVMLYSVKWEGYDVPTWEPMESFGDRSMVDEYRNRVGLARLPGAERDNDEDVPMEDQPGPAASKAPAISTSDDDNEAESDGEHEYEIERTMAHHLSDPRTHPASLGKTPVMLYQVKWKGFKELTWEPESSFGENAGMLQAYKTAKGFR